MNKDCRNIVIFVFLLSVCQFTNVMANDNDTLIKGLLARKSLIKTGTITYKYDSIVLESYGKGQPWPWSKESKQWVSELTVVGDEWILRWPTTSIVSIHRRNFSATYTETPQPNGEEIYRSLVVGGQDDVQKSLEKEGKNDPRFRILKAAGISTPEIESFIDANRSRFEDKGEVVINGISTHLLQMIVSQSEIKKIKSSLHPIYLKQDKFVLSLYIAPLLSYAGVRIEFSTIDGHMIERYESTNFTEVEKGIYFPKCFCLIRNYTFNNRGYYIQQYEVSDFTNVNKNIPESAFAISIPKGTRVRDSRSESGDKVFYIDKNITFTTADELVVKASERVQSH